MGFLAIARRLTRLWDQRSVHGAPDAREWVGAALIAAILAGMPAGAAPASSMGMAVSVIRSKQECFSDVVRLTGTIVAREEFQVRPDVEGARVAQLLVDTGDNVTAGQALARLTRPQAASLPASALIVRAPAAGIIARTMTQVGALVAMAGPPMFLVVVDGEYDLLAEIPSTRIDKIAIGQPARVDVVGVGVIFGRVRTVAPEINIASQTGQTRISLGADRRLRIGAFGRASVEIGTSCGAGVPLSSVIFGPSGPVVQVVRDNRIETRPVSIGLLVGGKVEIRQGLNAGELVVKRAGTFLREGDLVRPFAEEETSAADGERAAD